MPLFWFKGARGGDQTVAYMPLDAATSSADADPATFVLPAAHVALLASFEV